MSLALDGLRAACSELAHVSEAVALEVVDYELEP